MLTTTQTAATFDEHLRRAGFRPDQPDALAAWRAFKAFATVAVACVDDQLLFQCGVYHFTGPELFELDFTRQFIREVDGEDCLEQLHCTLYYAPHEELRALTTTRWSSDTPSVAAFVAQVEQLPAFTIPTSRYRPLRAVVCQEQV